MSLDNFVRQLAEARKSYDEVKAQADDMMANFKETAAYKETVLLKEQASSEVASLEESIRTIAMTQYQVDENKHPHENIEIKVFPVAKLIKEKIGGLKEWCFLNFRPALKLDTKVFEKATKDGSIPAELATVSEEPHVHIATKL